MGEVVDIFRGAGEVDKLRDRLQRRHISHFLFQKVFNRFDIVIGGALYGFNACSVSFIKIADNRVKESVCVSIKCRNFPDLCGRSQFL